jgi:cytokinin riboside 5'-monophosphate phosphoribohydrolase
MGRNLCVFCASSNSVDKVFFEAAREMGAAIAQRGYGLVYGAGTLGLMGTLAQAAHDAGGHVTGIIPGYMQTRGIVSPFIDDLIVTEDMRQRKGLMERKADAFVCLPGGFGTMEEVLEILTLKQVEQHTKPIVLLNVADFFSPLLSLFDHIIGLRFAHENHRALSYVAGSVEEVFEYLDTYAPTAVASKYE